MYRGNKLIDNEGLNNYPEKLKDDIHQQYKKSIVGLIPSDWTVKKLGELFPITSSKRVFQSEWKSEGIPFYRARELAVLAEHGNVENELFISENMYNDYRTKYGIPKQGDILVTGVGTLGKVYIVQDDHKFYFKDGNIIWFQIDGKIISAFLRQLYLTPLVLKQIDDRSAGTTVGTYTISGAKNTIIPFPPLLEQRAIAEALSNVDGLIGALDRLIAKKRAIKQAAMQQLLTGKTRLPGFEGETGYKLTDMGMIPEDWNLICFSDVSDLITCGIAATPKYVSESAGYPFLSSLNVKEGRIIWSEYKYISSGLHRQLYKNNPPKRGDILYTRVGTIGEAAVINVDFEFSIYVSLTLIKPKPCLDSFFLMYLLNSAEYKQRARDEVYLGGGVGNLNVEVVRRYPIILPSLPEQQAIAAVLTDIDAEIEALERNRDKTKSIKQGMMQQLLTGRIRLVKPEGYK